MTRKHTEPRQIVSELIQALAENPEKPLGAPLRSCCKNRI